MNSNAGWVSVGTDHDTAEFAVETIRKWWEKMGVIDYPKANELLITADGGGSKEVFQNFGNQNFQNFQKRAGLK